jgi:hypothetical protein
VRQALVLGDLENVVDVLLPKLPDGTPRVMSFSEFDQLFTDEGTDNESVEQLMHLLLGFSPQTRPVLARILIAQACMAHLILSTYDHRPTSLQLEDRLNEIVGSLGTSKALIWKDGQHSDDLDVAQRYWVERLEWVRSSSTWVATDKSA